MFSKEKPRTDALLPIVAEEQERVNNYIAIH